MRIACAALLIALSVKAQDATFSADVKVVNVLATVRDRDGAIVKNLLPPTSTNADGQAGVALFTPR